MSLYTSSVVSISRSCLLGAVGRRWNTTVVLCEHLTADNQQPDDATLSVVTAAAQLNNPATHLLVVGTTAPKVVPCVVSKIRLATDVPTALEDAIAQDTCTHVLTTHPPSPLVTQLQSKFSSRLVADVTGVVARDTFLVGDNKTLEQAKDMLKFVAVRTTAFATALADTSTVPVVQPTTASSSRRWAYRVLPVAVVGLGLLCCL